MKFREVSRKEFYTFFRDVKWGEVEEISNSFYYGIYRDPKSGLLYKLETIPGVINNEIWGDLSELVGDEDTRFYIETK